MRLDILEIVWYGKELILSVDFSKIGLIWWFVFVGVDNDVKVGLINV